MIPWKVETFQVKAKPVNLCSILMWNRTYLWCCQIWYMLLRDDTVSPAIHPFNPQVEWAIPVCTSEPQGITTILPGTYFSSCWAVEAELAKVVGYISRRYALQTVTHLSTNLAQYRVTLLIWYNTTGYVWLASGVRSPVVDQERMRSVGDCF